MKGRIPSTVAEIQLNIPMTGQDRSFELEDFEPYKISRQSANEGGKDVNRKHWPP